MIVEKDGVAYTLTSATQIDAFLGAGWVEKKPMDHEAVQPKAGATKRTPKAPVNGKSASPGTQAE